MSNSGGRPGENLDIVELVMAIEVAFADQLRGKTQVERERLIQDILTRIENGEFGRLG